MAAKELEKLEKEAQEIRYVSKPTVLTEEFLAEQIWDRKTQPKYLVYHFSDESVTETDKLELGETDQKGRQVVYVPADNEALRKGLVIVPSGVTKCSFKEVLDKIDKFTDDPNFDACGQRASVKFLSRVVVGSWFLDRFVDDPLKDVAGAGKFAPLIPIRGPSCSGKNRLAFLLRLVSYRPYFEMSTYRIPSLYRPLDLWKGVLVLDEADFAATNEKSELIHFLNCRATGTPISRQDSKNPKVTHTFTNFQITILTQRRTFDDNATESRGLPYYSETTDKKLPSLETDKMLNEGLEIQNMMLWLRFKYYREVKIAKETWINEVTDPRLMSSLLPILALSEIEPGLKSEVENVAKEMEALKVEQKANSEDGLVINYLWDRISEGYFTLYNHHYYVTTKSEDDEEKTIPLTISKIADSLKFTPSKTSKVLKSLNLCPSGLSPSVKLEKKTWRVIYFEPIKLHRRLKEFVVSYKPEEHALFWELIKPKEVQKVFVIQPKKVTEVTQVTQKIHGDNSTEKNESRVKSVTSVTSVTEGASREKVKNGDLLLRTTLELEERDRGICFLCNQLLPEDQKGISYFNGQKVHLKCATEAYRESENP